MIGKQVFFAHQPKGPPHRVKAIGRDGMVTLDDMDGEFAPSLFIPATMDAPGTKGLTSD
jgi:hypothetical protein